MAFGTPLDHDQLLTLARKVRASARDHDTDRLRAETFRLFEALVEHVGAEAAAMRHLPPGEARLLRRGQERVIRDVVDLALSVELAGDCHCSSVADVLMAQLSLQADDERLHFTAAA